MKTTQPGERTTVTLSTLVAIALLGAAVTAQPAGSPTVDRLASLESDLRYQLDLAYRHDGKLKRERLAQVDAAVEAYRHSSQNDEESRRFAGWMRESIIRSLPGDLRELPPTPTFAAPAVADGHAAPAEPRAVAATAPPRRPDSAPAATRPAATRPAATPTPAPPAATASTAPAAEHPAPATRRISRPSATPGAGRTQRALARPPRPAIGVEVDAPIGSWDAPAATAAGATAPATATTAAGPPSAEQSVTVRKPAATAQSVAADKPLAATAATTPAVRPAARPAAAPVAVNLAELNARIDGYHVGLDEVSAAVVDGRQNVSYETAARLVGQVEELAAQYQFVRLYYDSLTDSERRKVAEPRSLAATIALVEEQCSELPPAAEGDFLESLESGEGEDDVLAQRLQAARAAIAD